MQVWCTCGVMVEYFSVQARCWPWAHHLTNWLDSAGRSSWFGITLVGAGLIEGEVKLQNEVDPRMYLAFPADHVTGAVYCLLRFIIANAAARRSYIRVAREGSGGAAARFFKGMLPQRHSPTRMFIDPDTLVNLQDSTV